MASDRSAKKVSLSRVESEFEAADGRYIYAAPNSKRQRGLSPVFPLDKSYSVSSEVKENEFDVSKTANLPAPFQGRVIGEGLNLFSVCVTACSTHLALERVQMWVKLIETLSLVVPTVREPFKLLEAIRPAIDTLFALLDTLEGSLKSVKANLQYLANARVSMQHAFGTQSTRVALNHVDQGLSQLILLLLALPDDIPTLEHLKAFLLLDITALCLPSNVLRQTARDYWETISGVWMSVSHAAAASASSRSSNLQALLYAVFLSFASRWPSHCKLQQVNFKQLCIFTQKVLAFQQTLLAQPFNLTGYILEFFNENLVESGINGENTIVQVLSTPLDKLRKHFIFGYLFSENQFACKENENSFIEFLLGVLQHMSWSALLRVAPNAFPTLVQLTREICVSNPFAENSVRWLPMLRLLAQAVKGFFESSQTQFKEHFCNNRNDYHVFKLMVGAVLNRSPDCDFSTQNDSQSQVMSSQQLYLEVYQLVQELAELFAKLELDQNDS